MGAPPPTFDNYKPIPNTTAKRKEQREDVSTAGTQTSTAINAAQLPYAGGKAQADLTDAQLKILRDINTNARDELKTFEALEIVKTYDQGMRYFTTALSVPVGRAGDQDLVTLAAKVQDPTGAVMQGDIERYNNLQTALQYIPQVFRDQLANGGKFSPQARRDIIAFMRNRVNTYRLPYEETRKGFEARIGQFNEQLVPLGVTPIEVDKILPGDPLKLYQPKIDAYDKKLEADRIRAEREAGGPSGDILAGVPKGMQVAGEDIKGWRLSPEAEAEVVAYSRQPNATPEGYAKLLADKAVAEGHVLPSQREDYMQTTARDTADFFKQSPEQRAGVRGIDYSQVDKAASENAGLFDTVSQSIRNAPESAVQMIEGATALPKDIALSVLTDERAGTVKTFTDLAAELGQGQFDGPTVTALADAMKERYGSWDALQRTLVKDPLGLAADLSILVTGGGTLAARAPGAFGKFGEGLATAGKLMDPLSAGMGLVTEGLPSVYTAAKNRAPGFTQGFADLPSEAVAFPSGVGGQTLREGFGAGVERGAAGAPTPRSEAFTTAMRDEVDGDNLVNTARAAVDKIREKASEAYRAGMEKFGLQPTPLSIDNLLNRMAKIKPKSYDTWVDRKKGPRPPDHLAWEQMNDFVLEYAAKAEKNPNLLLPLELDQFKQDLFEIGSKIGGQYDKKASRIANTAYNAVRQELVKHDDIYATTMRDYETAVKQAQQIETELGLSAARGKSPNVSSATRKMQAAVGRNNANTNYGQRAEQVDVLNSLDPTIIATLAGSNVNTFRPRGLNAAVTLGAGIPAAFTNPLTLLAAPAFMPRVAGELAYGAGVATGYGKRGFDAVAGSPKTKALAELYNKYPQLFLVPSQVGTKLQETEQERLERMYADSVPSVPANVIPEDYVPEAQTTFVAPEAAPAPVDKETTFTVGNITAKFDPVNNDFYDVNDPSRRVKELADFANLSLNMYRGGTVQAFNKGGNKGEAQPASWVGPLRSVVKGATFAFGDEIEGLGRMVMSGRLTPAEYQAQVNRIRKQQKAYEDANPESIGYEIGGAFLPSLIPGMQGATAARLTTLATKAPGAARAISFAAKTSPRARELSRIGAESLAYGVGSADSMRQAPSSIGQEAAFGYGLYGLPRGVRAGYRAVRKKK